MRVAAISKIEEHLTPHQRRILVEICGQFQQHFNVVAMSEIGQKGGPNFDVYEMFLRS